MSNVINAVFGRRPTVAQQPASRKNKEERALAILGKNEVGKANHEVVEDSVIDDDGDDMSPIPSFADKNVHDPDTILMKLMSGPSVSIFVGPDNIRYTMPKRLLLYHSPVAADLLSRDATHLGIDGLSLPNDSPEAFANLHRRFFQNRLGVLKQYTTSSIYEGLPETCTLLCRLFQLAEYFEIAAIQPLIMTELRAAVELARDMEKCTPILPATVLEACHDVGDASPLFKYILEEICTSFSRLPRPSYSEYEICFNEIDSFRVAVTSAMISQINLVLDEEECGEDAKTPKPISEGNFQL